MARGTKMDIGTKTKTDHKDLKQKMDSSPRRSLREILQQRAGSSGVPLRGSVTTSESAIEISAKDNDESVVRKVPEVKPEITLLGVSSTNITL